MINNKKSKNKKFNFYWIYAIIAVILISINLFSFDGGLTKIDEDKLFEYLGHDVDNESTTNQVDQIQIVNDKEVRIFIKTEYLSQHNDINQKKFFGGQNAGPHYYYNISPETVSDLKSKLDKVKSKLAKEDTFKLSFETEDNYGREILGWIIFFGIMIAVWAFIMRRVAGGSGGAGGQIFNIGKSKAQVFGQGKSTNVNFNDVAGLEEAKICGKSC